eukprot:706606-Prymnesium_polylepis.1
MSGGVPRAPPLCGGTGVLRDSQRVSSASEPPTPHRPKGAAPLDELRESDSAQTPPTAASAHCPILAARRA